MAQGGREASGERAAWRCVAGERQRSRASARRRKRTRCGRALLCRVARRELMQVDAIHGHAVSVCENVAFVTGFFAQGLLWYARV